jgi:protease II
MTRVVALLCGTFAFTAAIATAQPSQPSVPPAQPVTETFFGQKITDQYRYFEKQDAVVTDWMTAEGRYTRCRSTTPFSSASAR